jgi:antibiotic biosynthesis monooxygenase (ABM) superfamily enzyme
VGHVPAAVVAQFRVKPQEVPAFLAAYARLEAQGLHSLAGFEGSSFHVDATGVEHTSVYLFSSADEASSFSESDLLKASFDKVRELLLEPPVHSVVMRPQDQGFAAASAVVMARVATGSEDWYADWQGRMQAAEQSFPGFVGQRLQAPIPGVNPNWITLVAFDSQAHLNDWMSSPVRMELLKEAGPHVRTTDVRPAQSAFESWFANDANLVKPPPAWKLSAIVLLVLYPVVMTEILTLNKITSGLGVAIATFIGNVVSVSATGFILIPWASRLLQWWLVPPEVSAKKRTIAGVVVVLAFYSMSILVFWIISHVLLGMP